MPRPTLAHLTFPNTGRGPMRIISSKEGEGVFDVVVANPISAARMGKKYDWIDARDVTGVQPEQLVQLIASSGVIFDYNNLQKSITPVQEVLQAVM